jgi:alcohol dehydrogenase class IV
VKERSVAVKPFDYFQPTEILFGRGRVAEVGEAVARFGKRCLVVTEANVDALAPVLQKVQESLEEAGVAVARFNGVIPNPTTDTITAGAEAANAHRADVVLGLGGGSSMDSAKAIAVEATHEGTSWDYLFYKEPPTEKTLPVIAVTTTSGTGSQVTQVAVVTHTETRDKSAIFDPVVFPKVAIVDPELMVTLPLHVTAATGFDVFCHAFESTVSVNTTPYAQVLAWEAIRWVLADLPAALEDGSNIDARSSLAWADTLAGLCIANAGVTLPHGIGMAIGGMYPHVAHGEALAVTYPAFTRFTWEAAAPQFATLGRLLIRDADGAPDEDVARQSCEELDGFLRKIGLWIGLEDKGVPEEELPELAKQSMVLPDYENNPRVVESEAEMLELLQQCFRR